MALRSASTSNLRGQRFAYSRSIPTPFTVEYLLVGGGAGGAGGVGGGGGGGGVVDSTIEMSLGMQIPVTIGAGGPAAVGNNTSITNGNKSYFNTVIVAGDGGMGGGQNCVRSTSHTGSGGGGGGGTNQPNQQLAGVAGGTSGADGLAGNGATGVQNGRGGGGGGASGNGSSTTGGQGYLTAINGTSTRYGSGGGAGVPSGTGGSGGTNAGNGGSSNSTNATSAVANRGGGGGGSGGTLAPNFYTSLAGAGGSGILILKYPSSYSVNLTAGLFGNTTLSGSNKITEITSGTGNISWTVA